MTTTHNTEMLQKLKDAGYNIPELEEGYEPPAPSRRISNNAVFKTVDPELAEKLAEEGYYQCARCGRVMNSDHYTKNKRACRDCNGLSSRASNARVRGLAWSPPEDADEALKRAHPAFEANPERAAEWAARNAE